MSQPTPSGPVAPYPGPPPGATRATFVEERRTGPSLPVRAIWYLFVGWWLTGLFMLFAYIAVLTIIGIPVGFWLVNRIPTLLTLRPRRDIWQTTVDAYGNVTRRRLEVEQSGLLVRVAWFLVVGWWLAAVAMAVAYVLMLTILGIPFGLMLVNRLPRILTLHRGYA